MITEEIYFQYVLWNTASRAIGIQSEEYTVQLENFSKLFQSKEIDVLLMTYKLETFELYLKPFFTTE